jgi:enoyl-CoA hydratase/carnithine racemase
MTLVTKFQQAAASDQEVLVNTSPAGLGRITLCRERRLNALGAHHVEALRAQLLQWSNPEAGMTCVLLDSNNDRSFCSGASLNG